MDYEITPRELFTLGADAQILDVRTRHEFEAGHIAGARNIPVDRFPGYEHLLDSSRPVLVVCQVGLRSDMAATYLLAKGFVAHNVRGGVDGWLDDGFPLVGPGGGPGVMIDPWPGAMPVT